MASGSAAPAPAVPNSDVPDPMASDPGRPAPSAPPSGTPGFLVRGFVEPNSTAPDSDVADSTVLDPDVPDSTVLDPDVSNSRVRYSVEPSPTVPGCDVLDPGGLAPLAMGSGSLAPGEQVDVLVALARQAAHAQARLLQGMTIVAAQSTGVGFDSDEVAFALHLTRRGAQNQVALAQDLLARLPMAWSALDRGDICLARAKVFSDVLIAAPDEVARDVATRLLPIAVDLTAGQLRARLHKELLTADPDAARARYDRSVAERRVCLSPNDDTTACLSGIFLPPAKAAAAFERVDALARGRKRDGDTRTLDQLRADIFCDLLAGVDCGASPVARPGVVELLVPLETLTGQSEAPAHLAGYGPVIADIARQVAAQQARQEAARRHGEAAAAERGDKLGAKLGEWLATHWRYRVYDGDGQLLYAGTTRARPGSPHTGSSHVAAPRTKSPRTPLARVAGCQSEPVAPGVLRLQPLQPCPPTASDPTARFPDAATRRWVAARDNTCRAPGCTNPARTCDTDHTVDHAFGGPTTDENLGLLCRHHHRLKHEGGHRLRQIRPGHFAWESPSGRTYRTDPDPPS
ncbi:hypothetical protein HDA40_004571 [Hamadaea flava]|uniref:DUF222 domain-containing protein n=1 Tax=Hamadaea flava TaxID=1742688 RepID=A0ABV8LGY8_9ACTN|nr:HNH endonuclease signature motif containing protein [Hamadaea flava]MCP2326064.1 hypothetical protein [Hamadaea flava]